MSRRTLPTSRRKPTGYRRSFVPDQVVRSALEARQLLSTATLSSTGVLTVTGTSGPDAITVLQSGATVKAVGSTFATSSVRSIVVNGLDGSDAISVISSIPATLNGGAGANTYPSVPANDTVVAPILTGGVSMSKAVMDKYQSLGGSNAPYLSTPTGNEVAAFGGRVVTFEGGEIDYSAATGAHEVYGLNYGKLVATAKEVDAFGKPVRNILGLATSDESVSSGVHLIHFQGGDIDWTAATGAVTVYGAIWGEMKATANEFDAFGRPVRGILGLPTSDESDYATTARISRFQGGDIFSAAGAGTHVLYGSILGTWSSYSFEAVHLLGLPTADEAPGPNGSRVVAFQGGSLYTSGSRIVIGANHSQAIAALDASQTDGLLDPTEVAFFRGIADPANAYTDRVTENLMYKLINGDAANATYQGTVVGNLAPNSPAWKVNDLERKWFKGQDHPLDSFGSGSSKVDGGSYQSASGPLFGSNGPVYTDITQGNLADCFFLAALAETAARNPQAIRNMITDNGDGTYAVRFISNSPDYETVDRLLPSGGTAFANASTAPIWVALVEKAYAQANQEGWFTSAAPGNTYASMEFGYSSVPLAAITGSKVSITAPSIDAAWAGGNYVVLDSGPTSPNPSVLAAHSYAVVDYNASTKVYKLYNPFGVNGAIAASDNKFYPGFVYENQAQISKDFSNADKTGAAQGRPAVASARPATAASATTQAQGIPADLTESASTLEAEANGVAVSLTPAGAHPRPARGPWASRPWAIRSEA